MLHAWLKITVWQAFQLLNKFSTLFIGNWLWKKQTIYKKPQLWITKCSFYVPVCIYSFLLPILFGSYLFCIFNIISTFQQIWQISSYGFPVYFHTIFFSKNINKIILFQSVFSIWIFVKNIKYINNQQFFWHYLIHISSPTLQPQYYNQVPA